MSQRSPQLPAVTSVHVGSTKQASTPSFFAISFGTSLSYPVTSAAVSWLSGALRAGRGGMRP